MGISVNWNGTETVISSSNAYAIYEDWVQGDIDLSTSQIKACESFLTDEEIEEIEYENGGDEKTGAASIDTEGTDGDAGAGNEAAMGGVAVATGGTILGLLTSYVKEVRNGNTVTKVNVSGFNSLAVSLMCMVGAAAALAASFLFDSSLGERESQKKNADSTNATLDSYTEGLAETLDLMNDDTDAYSEATDLYTTSVNENISKKANLQVQLAAALAAGDSADAESIQSEIDACDEEAEDISTDEMDEILENMEEYQSYNSESIGASGSGQSVSEFLKAGKGLGIEATICATLAGLCGIYIGILSTIGAIPKLAPLFPDKAAAMSSKVIWKACAAVLLTTSGKMASTAKKEFECGSSGSEMQGHVNTLNDMIEEHSSYMEATNESFAETDEESQEAQEEAVEAAAEVTSSGGSASVSSSASTVSSASSSAKTVSTFGALTTGSNTSDKDKDKDKDDATA